jgi:hypothetical protein
VKRAGERGSVLPETALMLSVALLIVLGSAQVAIIGYSQVSADGAAFVAAHARSVNTSVNVTTAVATAFPQLAPSSVTATPGAGLLQQGVVTKSVGGFLLLPGAASSYALTGADMEFAPSATITPAPFSYGASATLANYCPSSGGCVLPSTYSVYLSQFVDTSGNGNGWNGTFAEWRCHQQYYASLNFPAQRPTGGLKGSIYDENNPKGVEAPIYAWDTGNHPCH